MAAQLDFRGNVFCHDGNVPRVRARTAVWFADIFLERLAFFDDGTIAGDAATFGGPDVGLVFSPFSLHHIVTINSP